MTDTTPAVAKKPVSKRPEPEPREENRPTVDDGRLLVFVVTPMRDFPSPEAWEALSIEDRAKRMPTAVRKALYELATRGGPGWVSPSVDTVEELDNVRSSTLAFRAEADKYTFEWAVAVGGLCRARNGAVHEFNNAKGHFLIWWDSDLEPDGMTAAEAILRLLSHRVPVVGGMYCKRAKRPQWVGSFMPAAEMQREKDRADLLQMAELGGGFKCFMWRVFDEVGRICGPKPKPDAKEKVNTIGYRDRDSGEWMVGYYQNLVLDGDLLSEDYYLDWLCRVTQIAIWADTKIKLRHVEVDDDMQRHVYPPDSFPPIQAVDQRDEA